MNRPEVAALLRRARTRIRPQDVGLPVGERRRVAGLRREEVAQLAGVSVDYVVRLEQARGPRPSASILTALARALRLSDDERNELFTHVGIAVPAPGRIDLTVRACTQRLIDRLSDLPVIVLSAKGDVLAWNAMSAALLGDWSAIPARERNIVWQRFLGTGLQARVAMTPDEETATAAQAVGTLRATAARYPADPDLRRLLSELRRNPRFVALWDSESAGSWGSEHKTIEHPALGPIVLDCDVLHLTDTDQTVIVYSAEADSPASESLALLRVIGTQELTPAG